MLNNKTLAAMLLLAMLIIPGASAQETTYTPSTMTVCDGGTCTKTLYSGTRFGYEGGTWKPIENLKTFKGTTDIGCVVTEDDDTGAECLDWNYTSITLNLTLKNDTLSGQDIQVRTLNLTGDENISLRQDVNFASISDKKQLVLPFSPGDVVHIGKESTTIQLQDDATGQVLGDLTAFADGSSIYNYNHHIYIMFNITSIPNNVTVTDSKLAFYVYGKGGSWDGDVAFYRVKDDAWTEATEAGTLNTLEISDEQNVTGKFTSTNSWSSFDSTSIVSDAYGEGAWNVSFRLMDVDIQVDQDIPNATSATSNLLSIGKSFADNIHVYVYSSEEGDEWQRPYLNITFDYDSEPVWESNNTLVPVQYNPGNLTHFNVSWNTSNTSVSNISWVYIEGNWSGSAKNYTMTNKTYGGVIFNYSEVIPAGSYYWRSYANETLNSVWNVTDTWVFTIAKNASNPVHSNVTYEGTSYFDTSILSKSDVSLTLSSYLGYSDGGTATLYVDGVQYTIPDTRTWGVGIYSIKVNTSGNANYTSNSTGLTVTMTVDQGVVGVAPGGGGGSSNPLAVIAPGACTSYRIEPVVGFSGSAPIGEEIIPFTMIIYNGNKTQQFTPQLENSLIPYCEVTLAPVSPIPANGFGKIEFQCIAPNGTVTGNIKITTNLGCEEARAVVISSSVGFLADVEAVVEFFARGDLMGVISVMTVIFGISIPTVAIIIGVIVIIFAGLGELSKR